MASKTTLRYIALAAVFLIPFTPLVVANSLFFPFITGKAFYFRILVEVLSAAWLGLAILDKEYRPRFSWVGVAVLGFVAWMFVADLCAVNVAKAFFSNFERMEGWILLAHLFGFFVAGGSVLRAEKGWFNWRGWFLVSLSVSVYIVLYALMQLGGGAAIHQGSTRIDASLGNSAYLAIYFLFNTFIAGWIALTEKQKWLKYSLLFLAAIEAILIFATETRGTTLALLGALLVAGFLTAITAGGKARRYAAGTVAVLLLLAGSIYLARDSAFVQNNHALQRVTSVSLADGQTRFTIWHMAFQGFEARPVVGWGQEGFNYVFNQYYDPSLYAQEPWFDRAHNAFIDWLLAGGLPAFLLYLSLFGTAIFTLWRSSSLSRPERIALTAALLGYAFHNLFVFDNLYSYVYFFAILALIDSQVSRPIKFFEHAGEPQKEQGASVLAVVSAAALVIIYMVNTPGLRASTELIAGISVQPPFTNIDGNLAAFQDVLTHPSFVAQEIREQLVSIASQVGQQSAIPAQTRKAFADLALSEMKKQNAEHPGDTREVLELSVAYRTAGDAVGALAALKEAEALSPHKEQIYTQEGIMQLDANNKPAAKEAFDKAYALGPQFPELATYAAAGSFFIGKLDDAHKTLLAAFGTTTVDSDVLAYVYYQTKDYADLISLWQLRTQNSNSSVQSWFGLAAVYYVAGQKNQAIASIQEGVRRHPEAAEQGKQAIAQIESGTVLQ